MKLYNWNKFNESSDSIESICRKYGIENYTLNSDGSIDVDGDVNLQNSNLKEIPIKFNKVYGDFNCYSNRLTTLENSPVEVSGSFLVRRNKLTNLIGCPIKVGNDFWCDGNSLTSLELGPEYVGRSYYCDGNKLTNLKGISKKIDGSLFCFSNKLTTLLDGPEEVNGNHFDLSNNSYIYDFYGFPEFYRGKVYLEFTPVSEVVKLFLGKTSNDIIIEILNEYRVIREGRKINAQLLKYAFDDVGLDFPENLYIKGYEII